MPSVRRGDECAKETPPASASEVLYPIAIDLVDRILRSIGSGSKILTSAANGIAGRQQQAAPDQHHCRNLANHGHFSLNGEPTMASSSCVVDCISGRVHIRCGTANGVASGNNEAAPDKGHGRDLAQHGQFSCLTA